MEKGAFRKYPERKPGQIYPHIARILQQTNHPGDSILEIGCGGKQYAQFLEGTYIGTDLPVVNYTHHMPDTFCDAQALPFRNHSFDLIYMVSVLYLVPDAEAVLKECHRLLKKGGRIVIFDYNRILTSRLNTAGIARHVWSPWELEIFIHDQGFQTRILWDYENESESALKQSLKHFKPFMYLLFLRRQFGETWNIISGTKI